MERYLKVTKEDLPQREVVLNITVAAEDMVPYMDRAYQRAAQRVSIPGFRKGKAPRAVLERFVSREALLDDAVDFMVPELVEQAVEQEHLERGGIPSVEVVQKESMVLKATIPLAPKVVLDAYRDIRLQPEPVAVEEQEVQQTLEGLRSELAPWEPVERLVAEGDLATLDVRARVGDREISNQKGVVYLVTQDNPNPVPGFAQALVGARAGDPKEFRLVLAAEYPDRGLAEQECLFQVTVHQVKEKRLPELNDEFAKGVGEGQDSLEALKEKLRNDIRLQKEQLAKRRYEDKLVVELLARTKMEISPLLVDHEADHLQTDEEEALKRRQVSVDQYLERVGKSEDEHREEVRTLAVQRLTRAYAMLKVAELESLAATAEEVEEEFNALLESAGSQASALRRNLDTPDGRESLARVILNRKVVARLVEIARGEATNSQVSALSGAEEDKSLGGTQDAGTAG